LTFKEENKARVVRIHIKRNRFISIKNYKTEKKLCERSKSTIFLLIRFSENTKFAYQTNEWATKQPDFVK
jgi:hypothetical protein